MDAEHEVLSMGCASSVLRSTGDNNDWKNPFTPSIIKCFQTTSSPPILLVTAIANNFCSHTWRADFLKGFLPEKGVLLVTGLLQSTSCLWHSFTCCTSRVPREVTSTDIHLLMQEEGWKSANKLRESAQCLWFFSSKGSFADYSSPCRGRTHTAAIHCCDGWNSRPDLWSPMSHRHLPLSLSYERL